MLDVARFFPGNQENEIGLVTNNARNLSCCMAGPGKDVTARRADNCRAGILGDHQSLKPAL